jgi:hypothetical protein
MYGKSTLAILSALIALAVIAGIVAPTSAAMAAGRDQWVPQFKSGNATKTTKAPRVVKKQRNDDDDDDVAAVQDDDEDDSNELPEWADEAF